ncbi:MAG: hypothetical protein QM731_08605 [Chitinophagaceae bacterium]
MSKLKVERIGGLAGFGGANTRLRSSGEIDTDKLSEADKKILEELFTGKDKEQDNLSRDNFRYRISRTTSKGTESIEADEEKIPIAVRQCVKDELI